MENNKLFIYRLKVSYGGGAVGIIAPDKKTADEIVSKEYTYGDGTFILLHTLSLSKNKKQGVLFNETTAE